MYSMQQEDPTTLSSGASTSSAGTFKADPMFASYKIKSVPNSHRKGEHQMAWNCTGSMIAAAQNKIRIFKLSSSWNLEVDKNEQKGADQSSYIDSLAWHPKNPDVLAYITSKQKNYTIWDLREKHSRPVNSGSNSSPSDNLNVVYSPDGNTIGLCNRDNKLMFFDTRKDKEICESKFEMDIHEYQWDPSGSVIIVVGSLGGTGTVHLSDGKDFEKANIDLLEKTQVKAHSMKIQCLAVDPKGQYFATGSADSLVGLWDMNEIAMEKTFSQSDFAIDKLSFSHDGSLLSSIYNDKTISFYNTNTGSTVNILERESTVHTLSWHPSENILAFLSDEKVDNEGNLRLYGAFA